MLFYPDWEMLADVERDYDTMVWDEELTEADTYRLGPWTVYSGYRSGLRALHVDSYRTLEAHTRRWVQGRGYDPIRAMLRA